MAKSKTKRVDKGDNYVFGRPTDYSKEKADEICELLATGMSLRTVCKKDNMPDMSTVFAWIRTHEDFSNQYAKAKEEAIDAKHEELEALGDEAIELSQRVDPKASGAVVNAVRLKADNLKWVMSKLKPKKYGDKVDVTSDGKAIKGNTIIFGNFKEKEDE